MGITGRGSWRRMVGRTASSILSVVGPLSVGGHVHVVFLSLLFSSGLIFLLYRRIHVRPTSAQLLRDVADGVGGVPLFHFQPLLSGKYKICTERLFRRIRILFLLLGFIMRHLLIVMFPGVLVSMLVGLFNRRV